MSDLWQTRTAFLVGEFYPDGRIPLVLDDTLYHKTGRKVNGASWWRDAVRSTGTKVVHAFGLNLVVLAIRIDPPWDGKPIALPINMRRDAALYGMPPKRRSGKRGRPKKKGRRLPTLQVMAQCVRKWKRVKINERGKIKERLIYTRVVLWYGVCGDVSVKLVIIRDPEGHEKDDFFFTTDVNASGEEVAMEYDAGAKKSQEINLRSAI